jgi:hypothetical protein
MLIDKKIVLLMAMFMMAVGLPVLADQDVVYSNDFEASAKIQFAACYGPKWISSLDQATKDGMVIVHRAAVTDQTEGKSHSGVRSYALDVTVDKCDAKWGPFCAWQGPDINVSLDEPLYLNAFVFPEVLPPDIEVKMGFFFDGVNIQTGDPVKGGHLVIDPTGSDAEQWLVYQADLKQVALKRQFKDVVVKRWTISLRSSKPFHGQHIKIYLDDVTLSRKSKALSTSETSSRITEIRKGGPYVVKYRSMHEPMPEETCNLVDNSSFETGFKSWITMVQALPQDVMDGTAVLPADDMFQLMTEKSAHGNTCLKLDRRGVASVMRLRSLPISIEDGKPYAVSFYAKSSAPTTIKLNYHAIKIDTQWKRYQLDIAAIKPYTRWNGKSFPGRYQLEFSSEGSEDIWLDAIQLEKGSLTDYACPQTVEMSVRPTNDKGLFLPGSKIGFEVKAFNGCVQDKTATIHYRVTDYRENPLFDGDQSVSLAANQGGHFLIPIADHEELGHYKVFAKLQAEGLPERETASSLAVIPDLKNIDGNDFFGSLIDGYNKANMRQILDLNQLAGVKLMDIYHAINLVGAPRDWRNQNPQWSGMAFLLKHLEVYGFTPMNTIYTPIPQHVSKDANGVEQITPQVLDEVYAYCKEAASRFKNQIKYWEVFAEYMKGDLEPRARNIQKILPRAYQGLKDGNPDCFVVACGEDAARHRAMIDQLKYHFQYGTLASLDAVSTHPYNTTPETDELYLQFDELRSIMAKYPEGKDKPIWGTEAGYQGIDTLYYDGIYSETAYYPIFKSELEQADLMVRQNLIAFAQGVQRFCSFYMDYGEPMSYAFVKRDNGLSPKVVFPAYCNMVKVMSNAKTLQQFHKPQQQMLGYLFEKNNHPFAVIWLYRKDQQTRRGILPLTTKQLHVENMVGQTVAATQDNQAALSLSGSPIYIYPNGISDAQFIQAINQLAVEDVKMTWQFKGTSEIALCVRNDTSSRVTGNVNLQCPKGWSVNQGIMSIPVDVNAVDTGTYPLNVSLGHDANPIGQITFAMDSPQGNQKASQTILFCPNVSENAANADLFEKIPWSNAIPLGQQQWVSLYEKAKWGGPQDLAATVRVACDQTFFYLAVDVQDDIHASPFEQSNMIWANDALQIAFGNPGADRQMQRIELAASLTSQGPMLGVNAGKVDITPIQFHAQKSTNGMQYRLKIPWASVVPNYKPGQSTLPCFNMAVSDNDGEKSMGLSRQSLKGYFQSLSLAGGLIDTKDIAPYPQLVIGIQ